MDFQGSLIRNLIVNSQQQQSFFIPHITTFNCDSYQLLSVNQNDATEPIEEHSYHVYTT